MIGFGGGSLGSALYGLPVATINYNPTDIGTDGTTHGGGKFYTLYGNGAGAGALMAWAWGVSRVVDALIATPAAGIDPKHLAVTGCSRYGKGALVAGVYDQRIALTIPQEGGSGGCSAWRAIAYEASKGANIEQLQNLAGGTNWFRTSFGSNFSNCALPSSQYHWVQSYVRKYLLGQAGESSAIEVPSGFTFDRARWIDWTTPSLQ